ncbi:MAG TPA: hypothetical protein VIC53_02375 [Wenzhouxiangella sp.]
MREQQRRQPRDQQQDKGVALLMVLAVQIVLSLLATAAIREAWLQQTMVGHAWHGASHRVLSNQALQELENQWLAGGLVMYDQASLGIAPNDCALSAWLERSRTNRPWTLWMETKDSEFSYLIVRWERGVCQIQDAPDLAHTLIVQAQHETQPPHYMQSLWMGVPPKRHHWRTD